IGKRTANGNADVSALIAIIDDESRPGGNSTLKHAALRELERFSNSFDAVNVLIREIRFEPPMLSSRNPLSTYTAADVLSKMGPFARTRLLSAQLNKPLSE